MNDSKAKPSCQTVVQFDVYAMWCQITNQYYVGVTSHPVYERILQHKRGKKQFVDQEIQRTGWENHWDYWVVERGVPSDLITEREQFWVAFFDCVYPKGYNRTCGGIAHFRHTEEYRAQMSVNSTGEKNPFYGKHHTDKAKASMAFKQTGERSHCYGKHHTAESNEKNRQAHLGKIPWNKGIPWPESTKAKIRKANLGRKGTMKGRHHSEESKAIMSAKALARGAAKRAVKAAEVAKAAADAAKGTDAA